MGFSKGLFVCVVCLCEVNNAIFFFLCDFFFFFFFFFLDLVNFLKVVFFQFVVLFFCALFLNLAESCPAIGVDRRKKVWSWSGRGSFIDGTLVVCFLVRISQRFQ